MKALPIKKGARYMNDFIAKNAKQLDLCLRMLYAEKCEFTVTVQENSAGKIYYGVNVTADEGKKTKLREIYSRILS